MHVNIAGAQTQRTQMHSILVLVSARQPCAPSLVSCAGFLAAMKGKDAHASGTQPRLTALFKKLPPRESGGVTDVLAAKFAEQMAQEAKAKADIHAVDADAQKKKSAVESTLVLVGSGKPYKSNEGRPADTGSRRRGRPPGAVARSPRTRAAERQAKKEKKDKHELMVEAIVDGWKVTKSERKTLTFCRTEHHKLFSELSDIKLMRKIRHVIHDREGLRADVKGNAKARAERAARRKQAGPGAPPMLPSEVRTAVGRLFRVLAGQGLCLDASGWAAVAAGVVEDMGVSRMP